MVFVCSQWTRIRENVHSVIFVEGAFFERLVILSDKLEDVFVRSEKNRVPEGVRTTLLRIRRLTVVVVVVFRGFFL